MPRRKDPAAVSLGRRGGLKGGPARAKAMTSRQRKASARNAARARWAKTWRGPGMPDPDLWRWDPRRGVWARKVEQVALRPGDKVLVKGSAHPDVPDGVYRLGKPKRRPRK